MLDRKTSNLIVVAALALYTLGFVTFFPKVIVVYDESVYVRQAVAFASGQLSIPERDPLTGLVRPFVPSTYPVGTSALQVPFIWLAGSWRGAPVLSLLSVWLIVGILARWLNDNARSPLFALLALVYPPTLVLGRVALSDVPSGAIVTLGLWLFWRGQSRHQAYWAAAGFVAGASLVLRNTNVLLFVPFFVGAVVRRERRSWALVCGGIAGVSLRLVASYWVFGNPLFTRGSLGFGLDAMSDNVSLYLIALLVMVPGGLLAGLLWRGAQRPEFVATVVVTFLFFLAYRYAGLESGGLKSLILGPRFFIPLVSLLVFSVAHEVPVAWQRVARNAPGLAGC